MFSAAQPQNIALRSSWAVQSRDGWMVVSQEIKADWCGGRVRWGGGRGIRLLRHETALGGMYNRLKRYIN